MDTIRERIKNFFNKAIKHDTSSSIAKRQAQSGKSSERGDSSEKDPREKIKELLTKAIKHESSSSIAEKQAQSRNLKGKVNIQDLKSSLTENPDIKKSSEEGAEKLIQKFEKVIRSEAARISDENLKDLKSHITKCTLPRTAIFNNIIAAFSYSILLIVLLVVGNHTYPNLGKRISDFFTTPESAPEQAE